MSYPILDTVNTPADLRALGDESLAALAMQIRRFLIDTVTEQGGHLASNLGAVELTIAIHRAFDSPTDHILFDVGHQSYVHKLLTGRRSGFDTLRTVGGLSGFPTRQESAHDPFGTGHSSTALSAAIGLAEADRRLHRDAYTVALIGDGACAGGLFHEALNNCPTDLPLILILNDNHMSISESTGAFSAYLRRQTDRTHNYFEELGLSYIGDIDGHDLAALERAFHTAKASRRTTVIHVKTTKGNGYTEAENDPTAYHSIRSEQQSPPPPDPHTDMPTFSAAVVDELIQEARADERIVAVTAAMGYGTGLCAFGRAYPDRYFDVGIAEGHASTFSAGLAAGGLSPYFAVYSTFLQRAFDQLIHDVALQNLPVRLLIDRCGLSEGDGVTHHGIFDVAYLSEMPNMEILCPQTYGSARSMLRYMRTADHPVALRYHDGAELPDALEAFYPDRDYDAYGVRPDRVAASCPLDLIITYGRMTENALAAAARLAGKGHAVGVIALERLAPYADTARAVAPYLKNARRVLFLEEGIRYGGAGMLLGDALSSLGLKDNFTYDVLAISDPFLVPDAPARIDTAFGLDPDSIEKHLFP